MSKNQFSFELLFEKGKIQLALISSCLGTSSLQKGKKEKTLPLKHQAEGNNGTSSCL